MINLLIERCRGSRQNLKNELVKIDNFCVNKKNIKIENLKSVDLQSQDYLFHAGTRKINEEVYAIGGRVLNFVSLSNDFNDAKTNIQKNLDNLNFQAIQRCLALRRRLARHHNLCNFQKRV